MKKIPNLLSDTYEHNGYIIETYAGSGVYEAWLCNPAYCVKMLMFGAPQQQQPYEEFVNLVFANAEDYIETYKAEYEDDDGDSLEAKNGTQNDNPNILICVEGGLVQSVQSNIHGLKVQVFDYDGFSEGDYTMEDEKKFYDLANSPEYTVIY